jgi:hypothetical protein
MAQILKSMTVKEAAPLWDDLRRVHLQRWAETFDVPLEDFRLGHIETYEKERRAEVSYAVMWTEVLALRALLKHVGSGEDIGGTSRLGSWWRTYSIGLCSWS